MSRTGENREARLAWGRAATSYPPGPPQTVPMGRTACGGRGLIILMPTTWYFDGSGTDRGSPVIVLTGLAADDKAWNEFNARWTAALKELGRPGWHTTDEIRRLRAVAPMAAVVNGRQVSVPAPILNAAAHIADKEFQIASFAIDKKALRKLHALHGRSVPDAPQLCVRLCFNSLGVCKADEQQQGRLTIFFDRNEPFIRWLKQPWQGHVKEARLTRKGWPFQIARIESAASGDHPGLQAADLVSWAVRVRYERGDCFANADAAAIFLGFLLTGKFYGGILDHEALRSLCVEKRQPDFRHGYRFT